MMPFSVYIFFIISPPKLRGKAPRGTPSTGTNPDPPGEHNASATEDAGRTHSPDPGTATEQSTETSRRNKTPAVNGTAGRRKPRQGRRTRRTARRTGKGNKRTAEHNTRSQEQRPQTKPKNKTQNKVKGRERAEEGKNRTTQTSRPENKPKSQHKRNTTKKFLVL